MSGFHLFNPDSLATVAAIVFPIIVVGGLVAGYLGLFAAAMSAARQRGRK